MDFDEEEFMIYMEKNFDKDKKFSNETMDFLKNGAESLIKENPEVIEMIRNI